jgi:hypothetical protein
VRDYEPVFPFLYHLAPVYSWYGLCEYLVVLTNIAFHTVEAVDFQNDYYISVAPPSRLKIS